MLVQFVHAGGHRKLFPVFRVQKNNFWCPGKKPQAANQLYVMVDLLTGNDPLFVWTEEEEEHKEYKAGHRCGS